MNIFVAKLDYNTTSDTLEHLFSQYGEVSSCKVIMDRETGRSKGFGFVEMDNDDEAREAIASLNETQLDGREIVVKESQPKPQRSFDRGGRSGGGYRGRRDY